jgi:hypothetical protein
MKFWEVVVCIGLLAAFGFYLLILWTLVTL